ncbi:MAG: FkbM family methyltransferase [Pseudomonadota bacterium]
MDSAAMEPEGGWPAHLELVRTRHGRVLIPRADVYVGRSLRLYGEWCPSEWRLLSQILRPGDVAVDGGANIGAHALPMARAVGPKGRVYAVEPQPVLAQALGATAALNGLSQLHVAPAGLSDAPGWTDFPPVNYAAEMNFGGLSLARAAQAAQARDGPGRRDGTRRVPLLPLDELLALTRLRLLKLDIEGMEVAALRGARATLARTRPFLYIECDHPPAAERLLPLLADLGYEGWWHAARLFDPENWRGAAENVFGNAACVNLLAAPRGAAVKGLTRAVDVASHPRARARAAGRDADLALSETSSAGAVT